MGETGPAEQAYAQVTAFQREGGRVRALEGSVEPEYAYAHYGLARIEMAQGRFAGALTDLQSTIKVLDDYDRSTRPLAQKLAAIGEADPEVLQALDRLRGRGARRRVAQPRRETRPRHRQRRRPRGAALARPLTPAGPQRTLPRRHA
jgi:tetratricopeptide (TPR) repeat protein